MIYLHPKQMWLKKYFEAGGYQVITIGQADEGNMMADEQQQPMSDERLAEIHERSLNATPGPWKPLGGSIVTTVDEIEVADWISHDDEDVAFIAHAREDVPALFAEVERLRSREAEFEKQRADYHHVVSELARCERDHDALLHENDALRSKLAGADQRAATYSNELVMALDAGKRIAEERDKLQAENAAMRVLLEGV